MFFMLHKKILKKIEGYLGRGYTEKTLHQSFDDSRWPALTRLCREADLKLLDVGGRFGPLSPFRRIEKELHLFICEADKVEADRLKEQFFKEDLYREVTVIPDAIDETVGNRTLYLTKKRGLSSLYPPNFAEINTYFSGEILEKWKVDEKVTLPTITLDEASKRYDMKDVSFLKLDTQGSELPIMRSGGNFLDSVVGIYIEIEVKQFYEKQPILGEVQSFLEAKGFTLTELVPAYARRITTHKAPYSKSEFLWFHALYVRSPHFVLSKKSSLKDKLRLACYALCFDYFDLAIACLETPDVEVYLKDKKYESLFSEVMALSEGAKK
jgi:FkbM family methyltransferase